MTAQARPAILPPQTRCAVSVPGSTSNLGPCFDSVGCAVSARNHFEFMLLPEGAAHTVHLTGPRAAGIPATPQNLALTSARRVFFDAGLEPPPMQLRAHIEVPNARGLGSSSTAIIAGLTAGNQLAGAPFTVQEILERAVEWEGHPDNVVPALLGGLVVSASKSRPLLYRRLTVHPDVCFVFVIPEYEVRTAEARRRLPSRIPLADGVWNSSRSPIVILSMHTGDLTGLREAMQDRFHHPYRKDLFREYERFEQAAFDAGAAGYCISGAGSAMLAVCKREARDQLMDALEATLTECVFTGAVRDLEPDQLGTQTSLSLPAPE